jgi:cyclase
LPSIICRIHKSENMPANKLPAIRMLTAVLLATCLSSHTYAAPVAKDTDLKFNFPDWKTVAIDDHDLGGGVHMLESFGGNIGVYSWSSGVFMVDAEYPELSDRIRALVAKISPQAIRFLVDTHYHWDHLGGNAHFARSGATVIASDETRKHVLERQARSDNPQGQYQPDPFGVPTMTVSSRVVFHLGDETIEVIHLPRIHTDGDLFVHFVKADVIQTGDTFFKGYYPFIDVDNGGSIDGMIAWCDRLYSMAGPHTKIIPGHGVIASREDAKTYGDMLRKVRTRVAAAIAKGESVEQLISEHPLADLDPQYGTYLITSPIILSIVYKDLAHKSPQQ